MRVVRIDVRITKENIGVTMTYLKKRIESNKDNLYIHVDIRALRVKIRGYRTARSGDIRGLSDNIGLMRLSASQIISAYIENIPQHR